MSLVELSVNRISYSQSQNGAYALILEEIDGKKHKDKFKIYPEDAPSLVYDGKRKTEATELWKIYKQLMRIKLDLSS